MEIDWMMVIVTAVFVVFDVLTGFIKAFATKTVSSTVMRTGVIHKSTYILVIVLAALCQFAMGTIDIGFVMPLVSPVCAYIIVTEIASILENLCEINPALKDTKLMALFNVYGDDSDDARD